MGMDSMQSVLKRLDELIVDGQYVRQSRSAHVDDRVPPPDTVNGAKYRGWYTQTHVYLSNILGRDHIYSVEWRDFPAFAEVYEVDTRLELLARVRVDIEYGLLQSLTELVHAELFDDYLEMASHLLDRGYKDPAAVLAGSTCEAHIRKLCEKNGIATLKASANGNSEAKRASALNQELKSHGVYSQSQWRQVQSWLDIRNDAAHGNYEGYTKTQVEQMIGEIRAFLVAYPA